MPSRTAFRLNGRAPGPPKVSRRACVHIINRNKSRRAHDFRDAAFSRTKDRAEDDDDGERETEEKREEALVFPVCAIYLGNQPSPRYERWPGAIAREKGDGERAPCAPLS